MYYYFRVIEQLHIYEEMFAVVGVLLLLEAGLLTLATRRRAGAPPRARLLLAATMAWALGAFSLSGYVWWQSQMLSPNIPFHRLSDSSGYFDRPVVLDVAAIGEEILLGGAAVLLVGGVLLLLRALLGRVMAAWRSRSSQRAT